MIIGRIEREKKTVNSMVRLYCRHHHLKNGLCDKCKSLIAYSKSRLDKCVFGKDKPVCSKCPVHCYKPDRRRQIQEIMRFSGPRMIYTHPYLAVMHLVDKQKKFKN